jgi:hypothetical protein
MFTQNQENDRPVRRRRDEDDEDKSKVKKIKKFVYLVIEGRKYFISAYSSDRSLNRALGLMHAAGPDREYIVESDQPMRKPRRM